MNALCQLTIVIPILIAPTLKDISCVLVKVHLKETQLYVKVKTIWEGQ